MEVSANARRGLAAGLGGGVVGVAFVGTGRVSALHARGVAGSSCARLVGAFSLDGAEALRRWCAGPGGGCAAYASLEELLGDARTSCVFVLTPLSSHLPVAQRCLEAGKHVLVEKPVCATAAELVALQRLAAQHDRLVAPGHNYVYDARLEAMRAAARSGQLGKLTTVAVLYNIRHSEELVAQLPGVVEEIMTHHAYLSLFLTGERVHTVSCMTRPAAAGRVAVAHAMLQMQSGVVCMLQASLISDDHSGDAWSFYVKVIGSEGAARYSYNDLVLNERNGEHSHTYAAYPATVARQADHVLRFLAGAGPEPLSSLVDALECRRVLDALRLSEREGRHVSPRQANYAPPASSLE